MVTEMVNRAFAELQRNRPHSARRLGRWQYQHKQYQRLLKAKGVRQSMSRKGNCLDNAVTENFVSLLKSELLCLQEFASMGHFKAELIDYLDY